MVLVQLWEFNGGVEPKFWFGDVAIAHRRRTLILGMQWRDQRLDAPSTHNYREGWWYSVLFEGDRGLRLIHEDYLAIASTRADQVRVAIAPGSSVKQVLELIRSWTIQVKRFPV